MDQSKIERERSGLRCHVTDVSRCGSPGERLGYLARLNYRHTSSILKAASN